MTFFFYGYRLFLPVVGKPHTKTDFYGFTVTCFFHSHSYSPSHRYCTGLHRLEQVLKPARTFRNKKKIFTDSVKYPNCKFSRPDPLDGPPPESSPKQPLRSFFANFDCDCTQLKLKYQIPKITTRRRRPAGIFFPENF